MDCDKDKGLGGDFIWVTIVEFTAWLDLNKGICFAGDRIKKWVHT